MSRFKHCYLFFTVTALFLPEKSVSHEPSLFPFRVIQLASDSASNYRPYLPYLPHSSLALAHLEIERICRLPPLLLARSSSFARDTPSLEPNSRYVATHRLLARKRSNNLSEEFSRGILPSLASSSSSSLYPLLRNGTKLSGIRGRKTRPGRKGGWKGERENKKESRE